MGRVETDKNGHHYLANHSWKDDYVDYSHKIDLINIKNDYDIVRGHDYRHLNDKIFYVDYINMVWNLYDRIDQYLWYGNGSATSYSSWWRILAHDTASILCKLKRYAVANKEIEPEHSNGCLIVLEWFIIFVHSILKNEDIQCAYSYYTGCNPMGTEDNPMRLSKWIWDEEEGIIRSFNESELHIILNKLETKYVSNIENASEDYKGCGLWKDEKEYLETAINKYKKRLAKYENSSNN